MNETQREELRQYLIGEQLNKAEKGLEQILDGSHLADVHLLNALNITTDARQGEKIASALCRMYYVRLAMWSALGTLNNETTRGR